MTQSLLPLNHDFGSSPHHLLLTFLQQPLKLDPKLWYWQPKNLSPHSYQNDLLRYKIGPSHAFSPTKIHHYWHCKEQLALFRLAYPSTLTSHPSNITIFQQPQTTYILLSQVSGAFFMLYPGRASTFPISFLLTAACSSRLISDINHILQKALHDIPPLGSWNLCWMSLLFHHTNAVTLFPQDEGSS